MHNAVIANPDWEKNYNDGKAARICGLAKLG
jgi:hypothetical protein